MSVFSGVSKAQDLTEKTPPLFGEPEGVYYLHTDKARTGETRKGVPYFAVDMTVLSGPEGPTGKAVGIFHQKGDFFLAEARSFARAVGGLDDDGKTIPDEEITESCLDALFDPDDQLGAGHVIRAEVKTYTKKDGTEAKSARIYAVSPAEVAKVKEDLPEVLLRRLGWVD